MLLITLQLGAIKRGDPGLTFTPKLKHKREELHGNESDEHLIPKKMCKGHGFEQFSDARVFSSDSHRIYAGGYDKSSGGDDGNHIAPRISPGTPHVVNLQNPKEHPRKSHRRKGIPHRAPF